MTQSPYETARRPSCTPAAYGREGYAEIVERCCDQASWLAEQIERHPRFELLAPVRLNGVVFAISSEEGQAWTSEQIADYLDRLKRDGTVFLTPTRLWQRPAVRVSITNWRTERADVELAWQAMQKLL